MAGFGDPRISEKRYYEISPTSLTSNATSAGLISVSSTYCFKVGQILLFKSTTQIKRAKIQRVISETQFYVIEENKAITTNDKLDMSMFLVSEFTTVQLSEDKRPVIDILEIQRQVYEEEPTVALRSHLVDWLGRSYDKSNPMPVELSDGSISIGTVNAELEVQLSHKDNDPDSGDVHDSVRIGDGTNQLAIEDDGSINVNTSNVKKYEIANVNLPSADTEYNFVFPANTKTYSIRVRDSKGLLRVYDQSGGTDYWTVNRGSTYESPAINTDSAIPLTLYIQVDKDNCVLEVKYWLP